MTVAATSTVIAISALLLFLQLLSVEQFFKLYNSPAIVQGPS
jgi:hypothetical protein